MFDDFFHCQLNKVKCTCTTSSQQIKLSESYVMQVRRGQIEKGEGARIIKKNHDQKKGGNFAKFSHTPHPRFRSLCEVWVNN